MPDIRRLTLVLALTLIGCGPDRASNGSTSDSTRETSGGTDSSTDSNTDSGDGDGEDDGEVDVPADIPGDGDGDGLGAGLGDAGGDGDGDPGGDACESWPIGLGAALPCVDAADSCELAFGVAACPPGTVELEAEALCVDFSTGACADASPCPAGHVLTCGV